MKTLPDIRLRAIEPEDLDLLYRIENDRELWNVGTTNVPYSRYTLPVKMAIYFRAFIALIDLLRQRLHI